MTLVGMYCPRCGIRYLIIKHRNMTEIPCKICRMSDTTTYLKMERPQ